ncbi:MAG: helix-turn-helix domain-containing protein [Planctomycetota bacterium]|jgi:transcriptional regulator with XRE-family HTH domain|nr:helix-turn-helix domain-containing protein [Planctomycetota bacterium]
MGRLTREEKEIIAYNISEQRKMRYPGHGGGKKCAAAFGIPPQQWSPWESGGRTPDDNRLNQIAAFFGVTVADLRREPENWEKVYPGWMATKRKPRKRGMEAEPPAQPSPIASPAVPGGGDNEVMALLVLLGTSHGKVTAGETSAAEYARKMRQLLDFARFLFGK